MLRKNFHWVILFFLYSLLPVVAQTPAPGSMPVAARITLTPQNTTTVQISGAVGAVFPRAQVIIRNLHSGETWVGRADAEGAFSAELRGTELTPYQIHAAENNPDAEFVASDILPGSGILLQHYTPLPFGSTRTTFVTGGQLAYGAAAWSGEGSIEKWRYAPGETLSLQLAFRLTVPATDPTLPLTMRGQLALLPLYRADATPLATTTAAGWSTLLTKTGLPITTVPVPLGLGDSNAVPAQRTGDDLSFNLSFAVPLPADLPAGGYALVFTGQAQIADSDFFDWYANRIFSTTGVGQEGTAATMLPLLITVGDVTPPGSVWSLFAGVGADGAQGLFSTASAAVLANRVQFTPPTLIIPPGSYPLEPSIALGQPTATGMIAPPVLPVVLPGGEYAITLTRPDGQIDRTSALPFLQMVLPPVGNQARLTTLDPLLTTYNFNIYGTYDINLSGFVSDSSGQRYDGSGAFRVVVAEALDLQPAILPGTPFTEGDVFAPGVRLLPGVPADVTVTLRFFPLGRPDVMTHTVTGKATPHGIFYSPQVFQFAGAGEYSVAYEARYTDAQGRLWAASLHGAGVVASADSGLIVHGQRGIMGYSRDPQAWFDTTFYPEDAPDLPAIVHFPYFSGDVVYVPDSATAGIQPVLTLQDIYGEYTRGLRQNSPIFTQDNRLLDDLSRIDALPIIAAPQSVAYISAVRPDVSLRQLVTDAAGWQLPLYWTNADDFNGQIGVGVTGNRPGDYVFLFGGVVTPEDAATYAALAIITPEEDAARVYPAFAAPLFTVRDEPVLMFFHPTGTRPGQIFNVGDTLPIVGQVAPPLAADVRVKIIAPSGSVREFSGRANPTGYFYVPQGDFVVDEPGVWTVEISTLYSGATSAEVLVPPYPQSVTQYSIYVTNETESLFANVANEADINAGQPLGFILQVPAEWRDVQGHYTVATTSYVLDAGTLAAPSGRMDYTYSPATLARAFPNLEVSAGSGATASDGVVLTFAMTGIDTAGVVRTRTKMFVVLHDQLLAVP